MCKNEGMNNLYVTAGRLNWSKMSKLGGKKASPNMKHFHLETSVLHRVSCKVRVISSSSVQCQLGLRHVTGTLAHMMPDLENLKKTWKTGTFGARGELMGGFLQVLEHLKAVVVSESE